MAKKNQGKEVTVKKGDVSRARSARALTPFEEMDRAFEQMFEQMWPQRWLRAFPREWPALAGEMAAFGGRLPRIDVIDRDDEVVVRAELPGVDKNDLDVSMSGNTVTIKGSSKHEEKEEKGDYFRCEISSGSFARTVTLPAEVDGESAKARFADGVLELTLPKIEGAKRRSISID